MSSSAGPSERYQRDLRDGVIQPDPAQRAAVDRLQAIYDALLEHHDGDGRGPGLLGRLLGRAPPAPVRGLYLYGGVGRGKTYLMDGFFHALPPGIGRRTHFHRFLRDIHAALKGHANESDPVRAVASDWVTDTRVLCLDEFHVSDITDAMLLARLLGTLFEHAVTVVATSNEAPRNLYRDGLQRERFVPAIALIEESMEVLELEGPVDYRLRELEQASIYDWPHTPEVEAALTKRLSTLSREPVSTAPVEVNGRSLAVKGACDGVAWFDFATLCEGPRSTLDYIELARTHHTVIVSDIPVLNELNADAARRFIHLIDEFYDRSVNLIASAAAAPEQLYAGKRLAAPFRRTASRLREMQSHAYLARPHLAD